MKNWLIYSLEHGAFWRAHRQGYAPCVVDAGRYTYDEMREIVGQANIVGISEIPLPAPELFDKKMVLVEEQHLLTRLGNAAAR